MGISMTPYEFGQKLAADINPIIQQHYGNHWQLSRDPNKLKRPAAAPYVLKPEQQQLKATLQKQHPHFHAGEIQDIMSLNAQGNGAGIAKFIQNTNARRAPAPSK